MLLSHLNRRQFIAVYHAFPADLDLRADVRRLGTKGITNGAIASAKFFSEIVSEIEV